MQERSVIQPTEIIEDFNPMVPSGVEVSCLQCLSLGWTEAEIERTIRINPNKIKLQLSEKMLKDNSFDQRVQRLPHLPFVSKGMLSPRERTIAFLKDARFRRIEIAKTLGLEYSTVEALGRRIIKKEERRSDLDIPHAAHGENVNRLVIARGIHSVIANGLIDTTLLEKEPSANLSYHEARTLVYTCYGLSAEEIAVSEGVGKGTVRTMLKRARRKLGIDNGRYTLIAKGINEIVRLTS